MTTPGVTAGELARLPLFQGLPDEPLAAIAAAATARRLGAGTSFPSRADQAGAGAGATGRAPLVVVVSGELIVRTGQGRASTIVGTAERGNLVGWGALGEAGGTPWVGRAVEPVEIIELDPSVLLDVLGTGTPAARTLARRLFAAAETQLDSVVRQLQQVGGEGVITAG